MNFDKFKQLKKRGFFVVELMIALTIITLTYTWFLRGTSRIVKVSEVQMAEKESKFFAEIVHASMNEMRRNESFWDMTTYYSIAVPNNPSCFWAYTIYDSVNNAYEFRRDSAPNLLDFSTFTTDQYWTQDWTLLKNQLCVEGRDFPEDWAWDIDQLNFTLKVRVSWIAEYERTYFFFIHE